MASPPSSGPPFDKILNFRDVGILINHVVGRPLIKPGLLFRSARPDGATPEDRQRLTAEYKIKTIVDLRTPTEHVEARQKFGGNIPSAPLATPPNPKRPLEIPGIRYADINFNGSAYSRALIKQLTWTQTAKLGSLYCIGYRKEAISVLGRNVMAERGLAGLAEDSLAHCTAEVKAVFDVFANEQAYPVLIHCTQGKDRTGLTILLALMLLGVPIEAIEKDYRLSERELQPEREEKVAELRSIGLPDAFADSPAEWTSTVSGWIDQKYGGIGKYLESCGIDQERRARVKSVLQVL